MQVGNVGLDQGLDVATDRRHRSPDLGDPNRDRRHHGRHGSRDDLGQPPLATRDPDRARGDDLDGQARAVDVSEHRRPRQAIARADGRRRRRRERGDARRAFVDLRGRLSVEQVCL